MKNILNKIIKFINKHMAFTMIIYGILMILFISNILFRVMSRSLRTLHLINIILVVICVCFFYFAVKRSDPYMIDYISVVLLYIIVVTYLSYLNQTQIYEVFDSKTKSNINNLMPFFIEILVVALFDWTLLYIIKIKNKNKKFDEKKFFMVFFKSVLQSLASSVGIIGLIGLKLNGTNLVILIFIVAYAAFSYPILDLNKYEREKEVEQRKDKNS